MKQTRAQKYFLHIMAICALLMVLATALVCFSGCAEFGIRDDVLTTYRGKDEIVIVPDGVRVIEELAFVRKDKIRSVILPESVEEIGYEAFSGCSRLEEINLPASLKYIGYSAFYGCNRLKKLTVNEGVTIADGAFCGCGAKLEGSYFDNMTEIKGEYRGYNSGWDSRTGYEGEIFVSNKITKIADGAFDGATGNVVWEEGYTMETLGGIFQGYCGTEVSFPEGVKVIAENAFLYCKSEKIEIPNTVVQIERNAFKKCENLTEVVIPESVKDIGLGAFNGCKNIAKITVPFVGGNIDAADYAAGHLAYIFGTESFSNSGSLYYQGVYYRIPKSLQEVVVTGGKIGDAAFKNCPIAVVRIGKNVTELGSRVFENCNTVDVYYDGTKEEFDALPKEDDWKGNVTVYMHYKVV